MTEPVATFPEALPPPAERALYPLLPAIHRVRDAAQVRDPAGQDPPLAALLAVVEEQWLRLREDVDQLHDDWFIETCAEWAVAHIGELLGIQGITGVAGAGTSRRALVANTLRYRRRKGTTSVLADLAHAVTGWPARAVEYFPLLATTQHLSHLRPGNHRTPDLRDPDRLELIGSPHDPVARTVDVRHIDLRRGRHNLPNLGLHLWRLTAYQLAGADARAVDAAAGRWTFDPAGADRPLFDTTGLPEPLSRRRLHRELAERGSSRSVEVDVPGQSVTLVCGDLTGWRRPPTGATGTLLVAVDPVLGRLTLPEGATPAQVRVRYGYGFPGDVGAQPYDRQPLLAPEVDRIARPPDFVRAVTRDEPDLAGALADWNAAPGQYGVITVTGSASYRELPAVEVPDGAELWIVAGGLSRPHLVGDLAAGGGGGLLLAGCSVDGQLHGREGGRLAELRLLGSTVSGLDEPAERVSLARSVVAGQARLDFAVSLSVSDSIVAAEVSAGLAPAMVEAATVLGDMTVRELTASNSLFLGRVVADRRQRGCVRFSYLPADSLAPRRYRCQPASGSRGVTPRFTSTDPADPGFCQLARDCSTEIVTGADDEGELGAFHLLAQHHRVGNLLTQLDHYLPFGLEAGVMFAT